MKPITLSLPGSSFLREVFSQLKGQQHNTIPQHGIQHRQCTIQGLSFFIFVEDDVFPLGQEGESRVTI